MLRPKRQTSQNDYPSLSWNTDLNIEELNTVSLSRHEQVCLSGLRF